MIIYGVAIIKNDVSSESKEHTCIKVIDYHHVPVV